METKTLIEARKRAEKAVADMADGDLKTKAFEVILSRLLEETPASQRVPSVADAATAGTERKKGSNLHDRILSLDSGAYFKEARMVAEVKSALEAEGFHYKYSDVAVGLLRLTRKKELRRIPYVSEEGKKAYKYCFP